MVLKKISRACGGDAWRQAFGKGQGWEVNDGKGALRVFANAMVPEANQMKQAIAAAGVKRAFGLEGSGIERSSTASSSKIKPFSNTSNVWRVLTRRNSEQPERSEDKAKGRKKQKKPNKN